MSAADKDQPRQPGLIGHYANVLHTLVISRKEHEETCKKARTGDVTDAAGDEIDKAIAEVAKLITTLVINELPAPERH